MNMNVDDIECDESMIVNEQLKNRFYQFQKCNYQFLLSFQISIEKRECQYYNY